MSRNKRDNRSDTQFGRLFDYPIHLFAFGQTERESDLQLRFPLSFVGPKDFQFAGFSAELPNHRIVFPTGVVENGHLIARPKTQHPPQMCQLRSIDKGALIANICPRHEKTRHKNSLSLQQQSYPLLTAPAFRDAKSAAESPRNRVRFRVQDTRQDQKTAGRNLTIYCGREIEKGLGC